MAAPLSAQSGTGSEADGPPVRPGCEAVGDPGTHGPWLAGSERATRLPGGIILLTVGALMLGGLWEPVITWFQSRLITNFTTVI